MIQQLVYISTARSPISDAECESILAVSRRNNERDGITGLLVVGRTRFLQLLEGPAEAIRHTYARIKADPRHYAAVVIEGREVESRACAEWSMGFVRGGDAPEHGSLSDIVARLVEPIEDPSLKAQFIGFSEIQGRAA
jgi:hypothetical protein